MSDTPPNPRLAWTAFGLSLCAIVGPGFHWNANVGAPAHQVAREAVLVGIACALLAQAVGWAALSWASRHEGRPGHAWAIASIGISGVLAVAWLATLVLGRSG